MTSPEIRNIERKIARTKTGFKIGAITLKDAKEIIRRMEDELKMHVAELPPREREAYYLRKEKEWL